MSIASQINSNKTKFKCTKFFPHEKLFNSIGIFNVVSKIQGLNGHSAFIQCLKIYENSKTGEQLSATCYGCPDLRNFILHEIWLTFQSSVTYLQSIHLLLSLCITNKRLPFYDPLKKMKKVNKIVRHLLKVINNLPPICTY